MAGSVSLLEVQEHVQIHIKPIYFTINIRLAVNFAHANRPEVLHCFGSLKGTARFLDDVFSWVLIY